MGRPVEDRLDLAVDEEERLLERMVVLLDQAAGDVLDDEEVELARAGLLVDQHRQRRAADVRRAEPGEPDRVARRWKRAGVEMAAMEGDVGTGLRRRLGEEGRVGEAVRALRRAELVPAHGRARAVRERVRDAVGTKAKSSGASASSAPATLSTRSPSST